MAVSVNEALKIIQNSTKTVGYQIVPLENALGAICAQKIYATVYLPRFNNSAMDGYGVKLTDANKQVKIIETIFAGSEKTPIIDSTQAVKIMTGARVPQSVEAIVPFEDAQVIDDEHIVLPSNIKKNQHIRFIGEDIQDNELLLDVGDEINFSAITILASQGITHIKIYKKPKVIVFASGEELKLHFQKVEQYQIYNSNTPTLIARTQELGCDTTFIGGALDSLESIEHCIQNALEADLIITSGGVSVGEADFTKEAFSNLDMKIFFDGIIIKPGKPTVYGKINNTHILNLPGNPLACTLIFELFGKIIVQKLKGSKNIYHNTQKAIISEDLYNKKGRITLIPGCYDGEFFTPTHKRSPGMVNVLNHCNCMIALEENVELLEKNQKVNILPINWNFFTSIDKGFTTSC